MNDKLARKKNRYCMKQTLKVKTTQKRIWENNV